MCDSIKSQDYRLVMKVVSDGDIAIEEHKNEVTGLRVFIADVECPIVKCNMVFATEAHDDDGLPHTLEHLVFLGSEDYPYKGVLDRLANKCLADGTNAYTDTDHTSYSMSTAGADGFLTLLPIYLDHLLFPNLTDEGYLTEVHQINGEGEDAGVVYCEMQDIENTGDSRCCLEMQRSLYPNSGYSSETGGLIHNLRTSTNNEKVRKYHNQFYKAKNLAIIITGPVAAQDVFKVVKPIEDKIVQRGLHKEAFERPWKQPVEPMKKSIVRSIEYPCDTEDDGLVYLGFRGPLVEQGYKELLAVAVLLEYLNNTPISPIQQAFVECSEPYCSSVSHNIIENSTSCFYFSFESVGAEYLDECLDKLIKLLKEYDTEKEKIDMKRMSTIISRKILSILSATETSPHSFVNSSVVGHFLYGDDNFEQRCQEIKSLGEFAEQDAQFWLNLLRKYMTNPDTSRFACIVGRPSISLRETLATAEKNRIEEQQKRLKDKLPEIASQVEAAIKFNEKKPPEEMLKLDPLPSTKNIKFPLLERIKVEDTTVYQLNYDSIKTNFVTIQMLFNSSEDLTSTDRLYLPLLSQCILESPIQEGDFKLSYETFMANLFADTVGYGTALGVCSGSTFGVGPVGMLFTISMQVEISKYQRAIDLFKQILYHTKFTSERVTTIATRMYSDISQYKRSGGKVVSAAMDAITYKLNSNNWAANFLRQRTFLKQLLKNLEKEPEVVTDRLTHIRDTLTDPKNVLVHLTLDKNKLDIASCHKPWNDLASQRISRVSGTAKKLEVSNITLCKDLIDTTHLGKALIVGLGSVESNFMTQSVRSIDSPMHPELPALYLLLQYLCQLEGPVWRQIRGKGLSYHTSIRVSPSEGLLIMHLYKSSQLIEAYKELKNLVHQFLTRELEFEDDLFESAKSSLIYELINREKSSAGRSLQSLIAYLRNLDLDFNQQLINKVANVTKEELFGIAEKYLKDLFESKDKRSVVCCNSSKLTQVSNGLNKLGVKLDPINLEGDSMLNAI